MTAFELLTALAFGAVAGFALAVMGRWRAIGWTRALGGGALGGLVAGLLGSSAFADSPAWGELRFRPAVAACALAGGAVLVALHQILGDAHARRRASRAHRHSASR